MKKVLVAILLASLVAFAAAPAFAAPAGAAAKLGLPIGLGIRIGAPAFAGPAKKTANVIRTFSYRNIIAPSGNDACHEKEGILVESQPTFMQLATGDKLGAPGHNK